MSDRPAGTGPPAAHSRGANRRRRPGFLSRSGAALADAWAWRQLVLRLARAELSREHARLALGSLWWILDALLYLGVYTVLVTLVLQRGGPDYPLFIFAPLLAWKWLTLTIATSCNAIVGNDRIVRQLAFPRITLPLARVGVQLWRYVGGLVVLVVGMALLWPDRLSPALVWIPALMAAQMVMMAPFAVAAAAVTVFFRDTATLVRHLLRIGLFLSPVLFGLDQIVSVLSEPLASVYRANPLAVLLEGYRTVTFDGLAPAPESILLPIGIGLVLAGPAFALFAWLEPKFAKRL